MARIIALLLGWVALGFLFLLALVASLGGPSAFGAGLLWGLVVFLLLVVASPFGTRRRIPGISSPIGTLLYLLGSFAVLFVAVVSWAGSPKPAPRLVTSAAVPAAQPATGTSREHPIPFREAAELANGFAIKVVGVRRDAQSAIREMDAFSQGPAGGDEAILATLEVTYVGDRDRVKKVRRQAYSVVGESGRRRGQPMAALARPLEGELFGGGTTQGQLAFHVNYREGDLVLIYEEDGIRAYFSLER